MLCMILVLITRPASFDKFPVYYTDSHDFAVTYQPGGRNLEGVKTKVEEHTGREILSVFNGGYFASDNNPIVAVDLVVSKGQILSPYRRDLARPIITFQ